MTRKPKKRNRDSETEGSARHLSITILHKCHNSNHTLDYWLEKASTRIEMLNQPDRALLHALVYGVLRWQSRLDWIIDQLVSRPGKKIDTLVRIVLRVGLFQILYLDRIPSSAAVNTSVEWVKKNHRSWATGFVNSLLRRAANQSEHNFSWPDTDKHPVDAIATQHAFPHWLVRRWISQRGVKETIQLCEAINKIAPLTLRTNTLKTTRPKIMDALEHVANKINPTRYSPEGVCFVSPAKPVSQWSLYHQGDFQIQDEAAQIIAHLLSLLPGQRVWDVCAGLGTKTAHIAQHMENKGFVLATDHSKDKLARLDTEMLRLSIKIVQTHHMDVAADHPPQSNFDRILLDAPCTGLGVLQKNPDGKWRIHSDDIKKNSRRQLALLEKTLPHLAPDGHLVYAVCSTEPEENEEVIDQFLQKHQEFAIHTPKLNKAANLKDLLTSDGYLKTLPHHHQMGGFFAAVLIKRT